MNRRVSARMTEVGGGQIAVIDAFADRARAYCDWSTRSKPGKGDLDVCTVLLTDLLAAACRLGWREWVPSDGDSTPIPDNVLSNAKSLPLQLYAEVFEPLILPPEKPVVGDLSDDLIDIYRDIKEGLILYDWSSKSAALTIGDSGFIITGESTRHPHFGRFGPFLPIEKVGRKRCAR